MQNSITCKSRHRHHDASKATRHSLSTRLYALLGTNRLEFFLRVIKMRLVIIVQKYCSIFTRRRGHSRNINFSSFMLREAPTGASDSPSLKKARFGNKFDLKLNNHFYVVTRHRNVIYNGVNQSYQLYKLCLRCVKINTL